MVVVSNLMIEKFECLRSKELVSSRGEGRYGNGQSPRYRESLRRSTGRFDEPDVVSAESEPRRRYDNPDWQIWRSVAYEAR